METFSTLLALCARNSPVAGEFHHKGQWHGALMFFICAWTNGWVNNQFAFDLKHHRTPYDVTIMHLENNVWTWVVDRLGVHWDHVYCVYLWVNAGNKHQNHYNDVIMSAMGSQINSVSIILSTVGSGADLRKHQSCASLAFVRGIPRT